MLAVCLSLAVSCAGDGDSAGEPTRTPARTETAAASPDDQTWTVNVKIRDGDVDGGPQRVRIDLGDEVILVVRSDVADEVHVHGYDERADVKAGGTVRITFTADVPGVFVAELEERKLRIAEFEVR